MIDTDRAEGGLRRAMAPLRGRGFRLQAVSYSISMVGTMLSPVALTFGLLYVTGSGATVGLALGAQTVSLAVFLLYGGVLADRLPRHLTMMVADVVRGAVQVAVGLMVLSGTVNVPALIVLEVVYGAAQAFYLPASIGLTALVVPKADLQSANALLSLVRNTSGVLGPLLGGLLVATGGAGWTIVADGLSFLVSAAVIGRLRLPGGARPAASSVRTELADGFRTVCGTPWIWSSIVAFMATHVALAVFMVIGPVLLLRNGPGAIGWGVLVAALSVGSLLGDGAALLLRPARPLVAARLAELLLVPALLGLVWTLPMAALVVVVALAGAGLALADSLWLTTMQQQLPTTSVSKVSAYDWMGSVVLRPVGYVLAAAFTTGSAAGLILIAVTVAVVATRVLSLSFADVRGMSRWAPAMPVEKVR